MKDGSKYYSIKHEEFPDEVYLMRLTEVSNRMGSVFRLLEHNYGMSVQEIIDLILSSGYWQCWEYLDQYDLLGRSDGEIAYRLAESVGRTYNNKDSVIYDSTYWIGWFITNAMYRGKLSFTDIFPKLSAKDIVNMYPAYHEISVATGVEELKKRVLS